MKIIALFTLVIFVGGCREIAGRRVKGSGHVITENRTTSEFSSIDVSGDIDVYVKQDPVSSVKVEADDNILEFIEVHVEGSTLEIYTENNIRLRPTNKIKVYISNAQYKEIQVSGASSVRCENEITSADVLEVSLSGASDGRLELNAPKISVSLTGASNASIKGKTKDFEGSASGASKIRGFDLLSENANVDASGASHIEIYASVKIDGEASGASSVNYKGNAQSNVGKSGASSVNKKD